MERKRVLHLEDIRNQEFEHDHFKVTKVENAICFRVGICLSCKEVENCLADGWKVIIK